MFKRVYFLTLGLFLIGAAAPGDWATSGLEAGLTGSINLRLGSSSVTQSLDTGTVTALNSVACPVDDDAYLRRFDLTADGITSTFSVNSVDIGIESSTSASLTANLYSIPKADPFVYANLTLIGTSGSLPIADTTLGFANLPVAGDLVDPLTDDLVVEIFAPDFTNAFTFFIGSNSAGQTGLSYLSSPVCGAAEPTDTGTLGFPGMHIVMVVNGDVAVVSAPTVIPTLNQVGLIALLLLLAVVGVTRLRH